VETLEGRTLLADTLAPTAAITAADVTAGGGVVHTVRVVYTDDTAVNVASINPTDVAVSGARGGLRVMGVQIFPPTQGPSITAEYQIEAPGGTWDASDNGPYLVTLAAGAVNDTSGNPVAPVTAGFVVNIPTAPDPAGPAAAIHVQNVTLPGGAMHAVQVVYVDAGGVNAATIDVGDVVVTGSQGAPLSVPAVTITPQGNGSPLTATYSIAPPGGAWDAADDGVYVVSLAAGAVTDLSGNAVAASTASFVVAIGPGVVAPSARITAANVTVAGGAAHPVTVDYTAGAGIDTSTIDLADLRVTGPAGAVGVISVIVTGQSAGTANVVYTLAAPGGAWDAGDNGTYTVELPLGAVSDAGGVPVPAAAAQFAVSIPPPPPPPPAPPAEPGPDLVASVRPLPAVVVPGEALVAAVEVINQGDARAAGRTSVRLLARALSEAGDPLGGPDTELVTTPARPLRLAPRASRVVAVRFSFPPSLPLGRYQLIAEVDPADTIAEGGEQNNQAAPVPVRVMAPFTHVIPASVGTPSGGRLVRGRRTVVPVALRNLGNVTFDGPLNFELFGTSDGVNYVRVGSAVVRKRVSLRPGALRVVRLSVPVDRALPVGEYRLKINVNEAPATASGPADANNATTGPTTYPVG
jgi:hypothetical protein